MQDRKEFLIAGFAVIVLALLAYNSIAIGNSTQKLGQHSGLMSMMMAGGTANLSTAQPAAPAVGTISLAEFLPKGVPEIYGTELSVSFDKPVESLAVLSKLDGDLYEDGLLKVGQLDEAAKKRYIEISSSIACEYCCGATTLVFPDGNPACGCAHSAAMRGLAKYLLINHPDEFTDEQILGELVKWKTLFFPKQMYAKELKEKQAFSSGSSNPVVENVPDMVGGC